MSEINKDMSDDQGDIQLAENNCGIVYVATRTPRMMSRACAL